MNAIREIMLSPDVLTLIGSIEQYATQSITVVRDKRLKPDQGASFWQKNPEIRISSTGTTKDVVLHEVLHLALRAYGFPTTFQATDRELFPILRPIDNLLHLVAIRVGSFVKKQL